MGLRVNKRIRIAKGLSLNVGKKGLSISAKVGNTTINSRGRVTTRLAPGISYSTKLGSSNTKKSNSQSLASTNNKEYIHNNGVKEKNKSISIALCCLGLVGIGGMHKFYEGKAGIGIVYLFTGGLLLIGTIIDLIGLLGKPSRYYV